MEKTIDYSEFRQSLEWNPQDDFLIKGYELQTLVDIANLFRPFIQSVDSVVQKSVVDGKITAIFYDKDGNKIDPEQTQALLNLVKEQLGQRT